MSTVKYRHKQNKKYKLKGLLHVVKEQIIDGDKGLSFSLLTKDETKDGKTNFYRIFVMETEKDTFTVKEKVDDKENEDKTVTMAELKKIITANKDLAFVKQYIDKERGSYSAKVKKEIGGKPSKKASKKSSKKKASRKGSKKASKKGSRKW